MHHGVKGQKWGIRRYQNEDGSLTAKGIKEKAKMTKWIDSSSGRRAMKRTRRAGNASGLSAADMYGLHKQKVAMSVGILLGGVFAGVAAGLVSQSRYEKGGREFADKVFNKVV